jgi:Transcriptional regulatory protein, C terminal/FHA domain
MRATFAGFVFDSDTRELRRRGTAVPVSPKAFDLLELLVRSRPRAISKEEIHERLWPKTFVSDASLTNLVAELRAVLEDDAEQSRLIRTVRRFGYAFIGGGVDEPGLSHSVPRLVWETREIPLSTDETLLGRDEKAGVFIDDASASRRHARVVSRDGRSTLEDLGSKNGTLHNGKRLRAPVVLSDGDRIQVGRASLIFRESASTRSTQTARTGRTPRTSPAVRRK